MTILSYSMRFLIAASLVIAGWIPPVNQRPLEADWCQCVIFVLNLLGIEQIPGEYWTASSLAIPDEAGKTWMNYQGYTQRPSGQIPKTGDLLVLSGGAEVITVQSWDGTEHLVPVPVDVWAGHIGIVLEAAQVEKEGQSYVQVHLLSANWGVSSRNLGVVGSCFNVDDSLFLVPINYKKSYFFSASDPVKMRERMVNRAKRWSLLGIAASPQASLDGFPITPSGFISNILQPVGEQPLTPTITDLQSALSEIHLEVVAAGDLVQFGEDRNPGLGVIVSAGSIEPNSRDRDFEIISMRPGERVIGPERWVMQPTPDGWKTVLSNGEKSKVRFFRYKNLPGYPVVVGKIHIYSGEIKNDRQIEFTLSNGGGGEMKISNLLLKAYPILEDGKPDTKAMISKLVKKELTLKTGELDLNTESMRFSDAGDYLLDIEFKWLNQIVRISNTDKLSIQ